MSTTYLTKTQLSSARRRLTLAKKKGPQAVIDEVTRTFAAWDAANAAYPDSWHDWQCAHNDAVWATKRFDGR